MIRRPVNAGQSVRIPVAMGANQDEARFARGILRAVDMNVVYANDVDTLRRACANTSVDVVRLRVGAEYWLNSDLTISHGIIIQGAPGAIIKRYSTSVTPEILVTTTAADDVEIRDLWTHCPIYAVTPVELRDVRCLGDYGTTVGNALVSIGGAASGSGVIGCRSSAAFALGVGVQIDAAAGGSRVIGCDFNSCATPYRLAVLGAHHYGPDANHGAVTLY